ncbi:MAG: hypothetical protein ACRD40_03785 [Candidatus Acidiferrales bacterium]
MKQASLRELSQQAVPQPAKQNAPVQTKTKLPGKLWVLLICCAVLFLYALSKALQPDPQQVATAYCCKTDAAQNAPQNVHEVPTAQAIPTTAQSVEQESLPEEESEFIKTITAFQTSYGNLANEFQKSAARKQRAEDIAEILSTRSVNGWVGQVSAMHTTSDGRGVLSIRLPVATHIEVETMNNGLSDIGDNTLIPQGSPLYNQISGLSVGDEVTFGGRFGSGEMDYIEEASLTEEGSMTEPDFVFTFANVSKQ